MNDFVEQTKKLRRKQVKNNFSSAVYGALKISNWYRSIRRGYIRTKVRLWRHHILCEALRGRPCIYSYAPLACFSTVSCNVLQAAAATALYPPTSSLASWSVMKPIQHYFVGVVLWCDLPRKHLSCLLFRSSLFPGSYRYQMTLGLVLSDSFESFSKSR